MKGDRSFHIVMAEPFDAQAVTRLQEVGEVDVLTNSAPDLLIEALSGADALLVKTKTHVTARIIDAAPKLKVIGRANSNADHIDLRATARRDIQVVYAPFAAVSSSAEFALSLILSLHRRIPFLDRQMRDGKFDALRMPSGHEMAHEKIGFLGLDPVAEKLGRMCSMAFGSQILYHDPAGTAPTEFEGKPVDFDTLLAESDILSVHLPLAREYRGILNAERIGSLKPTSILVNVSRGSAIDTVALAQALKKKTLAGAALDVFETEPLPTDHPLRRASNCILTPHVAGATVDASVGRFGVVEDVVRVLEGQEPLYPVAKKHS